MSGICGLFNLDGKPIAEGQLRAMTALLQRRGPERTGRWREAYSGLAHTLLATTPELQFERQPYVHRESGCAITADVRLDNRDELLAALDMKCSTGSTGDAELILRSYLKWRERCLEHLLGDFAFAIWDSRDQALFCARDHFGLRPYYYSYAPNRCFAFASDPRAILVLSQIPYRINEGRIADFLVTQLEWIDYTSTFFEGIYRLPPGHMASVTPKGFKIEEYWRPEPEREHRAMSDTDYREGFLEVFAKAVDSRLRAPLGTIGSTLSGGLDSGSVAAIAKELLNARYSESLRTYSGIRENVGSCRESKAIRAATAMPMIEPTFIRPEDVAKDFEALVGGNEEPFDGEMIMLKAIYCTAQRDGRKALLDGAGGDIVLNEGTYVARLLRAGHFRRALNEIKGERNFWVGAMPRSARFRYLRVAFVPNFAKRRLRWIQRWLRNRKFLTQSLIARDFMESIDIESRFERMSQTFLSSTTANYVTERCYAIRPNVTAGRERYGRLAAAAGMEARDPFLDKRVVEYCLRLPGRLLMRDGWPKMILREVMAGKLPEEVRWCRGKPHLGELFNSALDREIANRGILVCAELEDSLKNYADPAALGRAWQNFVNGGDAEPIHSAFLLSIWLRENVNRPVVPSMEIR